MIVGTVALSAAIVALFATLSTSNGPSHHSRLLQSTESNIAPEVVKAFNKFVSKHHRSYITKDEYAARLSAFNTNYQLVKEHNAKETGYQLGLNQFSDWTEEEYSKVLGNPLEKKATDIDIDDNDEENLGGSTDEQFNSTDDGNSTLLGAPYSVDWRQSGAVTPP